LCSADVPSTAVDCTQTPVADPGEEYNPFINNKMILVNGL